MLGTCKAIGDFDRGRRGLRAVAVLIGVTMVGSCSSSPDVAATDRRARAVAVQDKIVLLWNRVASARAQVGTARRTLARRRHAVTSARNMLNRIPRIRQMLTSFGVTVQSLCAPNSGANARRALAYLNLTCGSHARWKIDHPEKLRGKDLVNHQTIVRRLNRVAVAEAQLAAVQREVARRKRVATRGEALLNKNPRVQQVLKSFGFTFDNLCIPVDAQGAREGRRQQAVRELNVTCPSV